MKDCSKCKESKLLSEFRNDKHTKSGKTTRCKKCLSTYTPKEARCYFCKEWFTPKQSNWKFCTKKCHDRYWSRVYRMSKNGTMYYIIYQRNYYQKNKLTKK